MSADVGDKYCQDTVRGAIDLIGSRWAMHVLWQLLSQECRYAELQRRVVGISQKVLSSELRTLVRQGLVERDVAPTVPPQVTYRITTQGRSLEPVFAVLHQWGLQHAAGASQ